KRLRGFKCFVTSNCTPEPISLYPKSPIARDLHTSNTSPLFSSRSAANRPAFIDRSINPKSGAGARLVIDCSAGGANAHEALFSGIGEIIPNRHPLGIPCERGYPGLRSKCRTSIPGGEVVTDFDSIIHVDGRSPSDVGH